MADFYQFINNAVKRIAPRTTQDVLGGTIDANEYFYEAVDVVIPLMPEGAIEPGVTMPYILVDAIGNLIPEGSFINGETIISNAAGNLGISELSFTTAAVPGFARGEVITSSGGATGTVARRYSDGRYLVYDINLGGGTWVGNMTGAGGGGGTTPGVIGGGDPIVDYTSIYDSFARNARNISYEIQNSFITDNYHLIRDFNILAPPGSSIVGVTSGTVAYVQAFNPPQIKAELYETFMHPDTLSNKAAPTAQYFRWTMIVGDLASILNPLAGPFVDFDAAFAARVATDRVLWWRDYPHTGSDMNDYITDFKRMIIPGRWKISTVAGVEEFVDGIVFRLYAYKTAAAGFITDPLATRHVDYRELWTYAKRNH